MRGDARGENVRQDSLTRIEGKTAKRAGGWTCARRFCASYGQYGDAKGVRAADPSVGASFQVAIKTSAANRVLRCSPSHMNDKRRARARRGPSHRVTKTGAKSAGRTKMTRSLEHDGGHAMQRSVCMMEAIEDGAADVVRVALFDSRRVVGSRKSSCSRDEAKRGCAGRISPIDRPQVVTGRRQPTKSEAGREGEPRGRTD
jgi:hypothetical protein